ncbi:GntR family transcriptional regulator [Amycolatopsis sp. NPDC054798]
MHNPTAAGVMPLHLQIADVYRSRMDSGELAAGDSLPTLAAIQDEFGCSEGTASQAMAVLRAEGRITGRRGKPPVVREPPARIRLDAEWTSEQKRLVLEPEEVRRERGAIEMTAGIPINETHSTHLYDEIPATPELAQEFSIEPGETLVRRRYEMTSRKNRVRLSYSVSYIPKDLIRSNPDLLDDSKEPWPGGHQHQLYTVGIEIGSFVRKFRSQIPPPDERQKWAMEPGVPMIKIRSKSIDINGRVVELSDADYPADRTEVEIVEHLERWPDDYPRYATKPENGDK